MPEPEPDPDRLRQRIDQVRATIAAACQRAGRDPAGVRLIAVTKSQGPEVLPVLRAAGIRDFGENRLDHLELMRGAGDAGDRWHYIGRIQGRQLAKIAPIAASLHSLCDPDHVLRLERALVVVGRRLPVFLQVNVSGEASKAGCPPAGLAALLAQAQAQPHLDVVGLMTMAPEAHEEGGDAASVLGCFAALQRLAAQYALPRLSMGMSNDFELAIAAGATDIRIGSTLFA